MALTLFELGRISRERRFILSLLKIRSRLLHIVSVHILSVCPRVRLAFKAGYKFVVSVQIGIEMILFAV